MSSKTTKSRAAAVLARVRALPKPTSGAFAALPHSEDYLTPSPPSRRAARLMVGGLGDPGLLARMEKDLDLLRRSAAAADSEDPDKQLSQQDLANALNLPAPDVSILVRAFGLKDDG